MRVGATFVVVALAACTPAVTTPPPVAPPVLAGARAGGRPAPSPRKMPVVAAAKRPVVHTYFDTQVTDDYEWLEDASADETRAFTAAQNSLARGTLDALPERAAIKTRVASIYGQTSPDWQALAYEGGRFFALKDSPPKQQRSLVDLGTAKTIDVTQERVIVDPNALDPTGKTTIDWFVSAPDAKTVAVSLSAGGSESGDVHLFEVATGKDRGETIARVNGGTAGGSLAWNADGTGFWYTRYPKKGERPDVDLDFYQQVWFHKIGTPEATDSYALGKELPRIAEIELLRSDDGKRILAHVSNGDGGEVEHHVLDASVAAAKWTRLTRLEDEMAGAAFGPDGRVYLVSRKGAPRGKVVAFAAPFTGPPIDVLPEGEAVVDDVVVTKDAIYTVEIVDGPSRVRRFPLVSKPEPLAREPKPPKKGQPIPIATTVPPGTRGPVAAVLPLPPVSAIAGVVRVGEDLLVRLESYVEPPRWMFYRANEHRLIPTPLAKRAAYDMNDVEVIRESCVSTDGTRVPMTLLKKKGPPPRKLGEVGGGLGAKPPREEPPPPRKLGEVGGGLGAKPPREEPPPPRKLGEVGGGLGAKPPREEPPPPRKLGEVGGGLGAKPPREEPPPPRKLGEVGGGLGAKPPREEPPPPRKLGEVGGGLGAKPPREEPPPPRKLGEVGGGLGAKPPREEPPVAPSPAYLTGYGGFDVTIKPRMRATYRVWLDAGGVVAETNLRGGGERGEAWHKAGSLTNKQNVFDDFAACAKALVDLGYTTPEKLAISGRSNGGLLMGAALTQHPELYRAVASAVGIYDMLRTELSSNGAFNVTEYGSVKDEAQFRALERYSPFHNVKDDVAYPAVLFMTGANDPRVDPYHSRKMAARLQAATSSDRPILLRASADTGHGMGTPLAVEIEETSDLLAFLMHEVGAKL